MERIIINGFFGKGNCGDEAILQTWHEKLSNRFRIVASMDSNVVEEKEWEDFDFYSEIDIIQNRRVDIFCREDIYAYIIGGGGLGLGFGVEQWLHTILRSKKRFYLGTIVHSEFFDENQDLIDINKLFFKSFDMISVRDKKSKENLKEIFDTESSFYPDIATALSLEEEEIKTNKRFITVTVRDNNVNDIISIKKWINKIKNYAIKNNFDIIYLPFDKTDEKLMESLSLDIKYEKIYWYPKKAKYIISKSEMCFSIGRFHPIVFGLSTGVTSYFINCQEQDSKWRYVDGDKDKNFEILNDCNSLEFYLTNDDIKKEFKKNPRSKEISKEIQNNINEFFEKLNEIL